MSEAIKLFLYQIKLQHGLPFEIRIPNKTTLKPFKSTDKGEGLNYYDSPKDMFKKLGI